MFFELQSHVRSIDVILNFHKTEGFLKEYQYRTKMPQPIVFILSCHLNTDPLVCTKGSVQCFIRRRCKASFRGWVLLICDPPINPRSTPWKFYRARSNLFQSLYHKMHSAKKKKLRLQYSFKIIIFYFYNKKKINNENIYINENRGKKL